ncbi:hypothetical protein Goklo_008201 [Gossypium klotzschianum]|uniref:DUF4283 domain-containing protein n=1 Tax=Gossypium klotzschianum TaxID=34286 RepID=A0A7J8UZ15_9ROSI|nr:hypothetical protein [Gossypium klotzschianum]
MSHVLGGNLSKLVRFLMIRRIWLRLVKKGWLTDVDSVDGDVCFDDVVSDSEETVVSGTRAIFLMEEKQDMCKAWCITLKPSCDKIESLVAWVHFSKLPLEYYTVMAIQRITFCVGRVVHIDQNMEDCGKFGHRKDRVSNGKSLIGSEFRHDMGRFSTLSHVVDDSGWDEKRLETEERGGIKINPRKQEGQLKKQAEKLTDLARLDSLIGPPFDVNIIDRTLSNPKVNLNHVPSPLKDVGKLAPCIVSKDMATVTPQNMA